MSAPLWSRSLPALTASAFSTPHRRPLLRAPNAPNACFRCVRGVSAFAFPWLFARRSRDRWRLSRPARRRSAAPLAIRLRLIRGASILRKGTIHNGRGSVARSTRCPAVRKLPVAPAQGRWHAGQRAGLTLGGFAHAVETFRVGSGRPSRLRADDPAAARHAAGNAQEGTKASTLGFRPDQSAARQQRALAADSVGSACAAKRGEASPPVYQKPQRVSAGAYSVRTVDHSTNHPR